jgi:hypothetical protein
MANMHGGAMANDENDPLDYTDKYNTPLSPAEEDQFQGWTARQSKAIGRDVSKDTYDYDLRGWWKANGGPDLEGGHLTDQWKKPNHPTFSTGSMYHGVDGNDGGEWGKRSDGSWTFAPGKTNLQNFSAGELQDYFKRVEPSNVLLPQKLGISEQAGEAWRQGVMQRRDEEFQDKWSGPPAMRIFASTIIGGDRSKITEKNFSPDELDILREAGEKALSKFGQPFRMNKVRPQIQYGDYGEGDQPEKSLTSEGTEAFMHALTDTRSSLAFTLGMANVRKDPNGDIVINDKYDFDSRRSTVDAARKNLGVTRMIMTGLAQNGLLGVGNTIGNLVAPEGEGRDVEIRIPPKKGR